jgi:eukaryotic-like serine/threonine-protein kinase
MEHPSDRGSSMDALFEAAGPLAPGEQVGAYRVVREVGRGGMATVWLARDEKHDRQVAVKVLRGDLAAAIGSARFEREIRVAARLQHPHILALYDSGEIERAGTRLLWYAMPFVEGESLRDRLQRERRLSPPVGVAIAREVADALALAHSEGIVHRDIKPENILLARGHALVADFGIARAAAAPTGERRPAGTVLTEIGMSIGTPAYMSPEQAAGEAELDGRSDLYSLGCVLFELLAGAPPFSGTTAAAVFAKHFTAAPPPIRTSVPEVPAWLDAAVARLLAKLPEDRFQSAEDLIAALDQRGSGTPAPTVIVRQETAPAAPAPPAQVTDVAVLDFTNLSADPGAAWLASGIAETVQVDLQRVRGITVTTRDRVARATRAAGDVRTAADAVEIGRTLNARRVIWGSVQVAGPRVRITTQILAVESGAPLATEKTDGALEDIFALQDQVVSRVLTALELELSSGERARAERPDTEVLGAYASYARGRQLFRGFGPAAFDEAERCFQHAIAADPAYALAYSGLGSLHAFRYIVRTRREDLLAAVRLLERALELDPELAEPYEWLTYAYSRLGRLDDAEAAGVRATALAPDSSQAFYMLAVARHLRAVVEGRPEGVSASVEAYARAIRLEPANQHAHMGLGWLHAVHGRYALAAKLLDGAVEMEGSAGPRLHRFAGALTLRGLLHVYAGEFVPGKALLGRAVQLYPEVDHVYAHAFTAMARCGLGEAAGREGVDDRALEEYGSAREMTERYQEKLGMGYLAVRSRLGLARALHRLRMTREERAHAAAAADLLERREGYVFAWMWGGSEGEALYDLAAYRAVTGDLAAAVDCLRRALRVGWADASRLALDPDFARYRGEPALEEVRALLERSGMTTAAQESASPSA